MSTPNGATPLCIGVLGCAAFAARKMLPALAAAADEGGLRLVAIASRYEEKARQFAERFDCEPMRDYDALLARSDVDAVYVPLPTGMHADWVPRALAAGKHVLAEKALAMNAESAAAMFDAARRAGRLLVENWAFLRHPQHAFAQECVATGAIGDVRSLRVAIGFPPLPADDFRYDRALGGGVLFDIGGYGVHAASLWLGRTLEVAGASLRHEQGIDVAADVLLRAPDGVVAHLDLGFGRHYQSRYELWGTEGRLVVERAFAVPPEHAAIVRIERQDGTDRHALPAFDQLRAEWLAFAAAVRGGVAIDDQESASRHVATLLDTIRATGER